MNAIATFAWLTFHEARRRSVVLAALVLGAVFLLLFGIGLSNIVSSAGATPTPAVTRTVLRSLLTLAGLYVVHFLTIVLAIAATVDAISGEIGSHTIQSLVIKPLARWQVIAGKWLGYVAMVMLYSSLLSAGVLLESRFIAGYAPPNAAGGVALIVMQAAVLVSLSLLIGVFVSTLTNGVILFMLYGLAFIGSWVEQLGALLNVPATATIGVVSSLILPVEALWRLASSLLQPPLLDNLGFSPFSLGAVPSPAMVVYAVVYTLLILALAMRAFARRDL